MAILQSHGILLVNSMPTHTPAPNQAKLARLQDTFTFYYYNGIRWLTARLDAPETYSGNIIPDKSDLGTALMALESAIEGIIRDGEDTPLSGDTAIKDVNLTSGKLEKSVGKSKINKD